MKKQRLIILFLLPLFAALLSCDKNEPKKNETFFCKVNGEKFRPDRDSSPIGGIGSSPLRVNFDKTNNWFSILVRQVANSMSIIIKLPNNESIEQKEYTLSDNVNKSKAYYNLNYSAINSEELISKSGKLIIIKKDGFLIWGTFEFTCTSAKTGKEYKITEGKFNNLSY